MKLVIKLKKQPSAGAENGGGKDDERQNQHARATTSGKTKSGSVGGGKHGSTAALLNSEEASQLPPEYFDVASKVKSRKRKGVKHFTATKLGAGLERTQGVGSPPEEPRAKKPKKHKVKREKSPKIRFQVKSEGRPASPKKTAPTANLGARETASGVKIVKTKRSLKERIAIRGKIKGVLGDIERLDPNQIFKYPVTEDIAPGYFSLVDHPICLVDMDEKLKNNEYTAWNVFWADCVLMFTNAMKYNPDDSFFFKEAVSMLKQAARIVTDASGGEMDAVADVPHHLRGSSPGNLTQRRTESNISGSIFSGGDGADQAKSTVSSGQPKVSDQRKSDSKNVVKHALHRRNTFQPPTSDRIMGNLSDLVNGQGLAFLDGGKHLVLRAVTTEDYTNSLRRFCAGLPSAASNYIIKKAIARAKATIGGDQGKPEAKKEEEGGGGGAQPKPAKAAPPPPAGAVPGAPPPAAAAAAPAPAPAAAPPQAISK